MLKEAEEVSKDDEAGTSTPQPRKKAKTKIGTKHKKKKKPKTPGKGKDDEDYEVRFTFIRNNSEWSEVFLCFFTSNKSIKITVRFVSKVVRLFFVIHALGRITWSVSIRSWKKPQKESGPALIVKVKEEKRKKRMTSTMSSVRFARTVENFFVVTLVLGLTIHCV